MPRFGAVIGIGSINKGLDVIKSVESGKITSFDTKMRDALNSGYTKLLDASFDKIAGLLIGFVFKGLTEELAKGVGGDLVGKVRETAQKTFKINMKGLVAAGSTVSFGLDFIPFVSSPLGAVRCSPTSMRT
jgi:hypothetical protein